MCRSKYSAAPMRTRPPLSRLRVGQEDFAMLGQPDAARIAHDQARADLIFKTFDVKTHRRLSEIHLARSLGKAAGVADRREGS